MNLKLHYTRAEKLQNDIYSLTFINEKETCFSLNTLRELNIFLDYLEEISKRENKTIYYIVQGKIETGIFNLGGDLALFKELAEDKNLKKIQEYGYNCIKLIHRNLHMYKHNVIGIAIINGEARGGGFEAALSFERTVGVKNMKVSLPEYIMGFFPGMGAFEMLSRKVGYVKTKNIIMENINFTTDKLYEDGVIDALYDSYDDALRGVLKYIHIIKKNPNVFFALKKMEERENDIGYEELKSSVELWAEVIYNLKSIHLKKIEKILTFQKRQKENHQEQLIYSKCKNIIE